MIIHEKHLYEKLHYVKIIDEKGVL